MLNGSFALHGTPLNSGAPIYSVVPFRVKFGTRCQENMGIFQIQGAEFKSYTAQDKGRLKFSLKHLKEGSVKHINRVSKT